MIKALQFCYSTAFVFLRVASKQPQKPYLPQKMNLTGFCGRVIGFVFSEKRTLYAVLGFVFLKKRNAPLGCVFRVHFLGSVYEVVGGHKIETPKNEPPKTDAMYKI